MIDFMPACPQCGTSVAPTAVSCPNCGYTPSQVRARAAPGAPGPQGGATVGGGTTPTMNMPGGGPARAPTAASPRMDPSSAPTAAAHAPTGAGAPPPGPPPQNYPAPPPAAPPGYAAQPQAGPGYGTQPPGYPPPQQPPSQGAPSYGGGAPSYARSQAGYPQAPQPRVDPYQPGKVIAGKFQIVDLLGQGGMGKVFKAKHLSLDKLVCIKMLKPALLDDPTVVGRFEREAKSASRLNHAHSIQVLDFGQDEEGSLYIVMEYVQGRDLRKVLKEEFPLGEPRICHIMEQVLSALAEAHAMGVVHRDLKPENIMIEPRRTEKDFAKVLDFGIAKIQDAGTPQLTRADVVAGTPLYMSPEQATGSAVDHRADIYACGVMLYQLTTGMLPFEGQNSMEILTKHVTTQPVPPRQRRPEVAISEDMETLIIRTMEKDPAKRPQTAEELRKELMAIAEKAKKQIAPTPPPSAPGGTLVHPLETPKKPLNVALIAGLGGAAVAVASAVFVVIASRAPAATVPPGESGAASTSAPASTAAAVTPSTPSPGSSATTPAPSAPAPHAPATPSPSPAAVHPAAPALAAPSPASPSPAPPPPETAAAPPPAAPPAEDVAAKYPKGNRGKAKEIYEEAYLDFQEEKIDDALPKFQQAVKADPSWADAHLRLADCYFKKRQMDKAAEEYRALLALDPKHIKAKFAQSIVDKFGK